MLYWVFGLSLSALIILLAAKMFELWLKRVFFISKALTRFDPVVEKWIFVSIKTVREHGASFKRFFYHYIPAYSKKAVYRLKDETKNKFDIISEKTRGKLDFKDAEKRNSDFWETIAKHKNDSSNNRKDKEL